MADFLSTPVEYLKGMGPAKGELLKKELGIFTFGDLIGHYPFRYVDRTKIYRVNELNPDLQYIQLKGVIKNIHLASGKGPQRLVAEFTDESGSMELVWFKAINWIMKYLKTNVPYIIFGKPNLFNNKYSIIHPDIEQVTENQGGDYSFIQPVYNVTEKMKARGIDSKGIQKLIRALFDIINKDIPEILPESLISNYRLVNRAKALEHIHFPPDFDSQAKAVARLKFEELFLLQLKMLRLKNKRKEDVKGLIFNKIGEYFNTFYREKLPFELTGAQKRVLKEIRADMGTGKQMNRLVQGDVGSGKTVVALMSMLMALDNGAQACMMAPTEILANQHFLGISRLLEGMHINCRLLTGSSNTKERRVIAEELENGSLHILIGTHALIEDNVKFSNLGLVIIDEQHRFGVAQRGKLWAKAEIFPHVLVMTATPIPRTLAMTVYGDLDTSVIDELPAGRKPIHTAWRNESNRFRIFHFLKEEIEKGRQVYIVYPLIEESEKLDYRNLMEGFDMVSDFFPPPEFQVGMVHGRMKPAEKDQAMAMFKKGITNIMVATTVIEVGVDVPNATVMVIENAEKFGLSQLHQLRGRVGRGGEQSYCILLTSNKISADGRQRLETMVRTNNGFEIAEADMKLRGPGDIEGTRQSGILDLKLADIAKDSQLIQLSREAAQQLLNNDPSLSRPENQALARFVQTKGQAKIWARVS